MDVGASYWVRMGVVVEEVSSVVVLVVDIPANAGDAQGVCLIIGVRKIP